MEHHQMIEPKPLTPKQFAVIFDRHESYWDDRRSEMRRLRHAYLMRFWKRTEDYDETLLVETARAYELVESYVASLFVRDPSVVVKPDVHGIGNPEGAEKVANRWLRRSRNAIEDGLRIALIYPFAALKLSVGRAKSPLNRIDIAAVSPWDVVVDDTASSWESQRFCAHRYLIPLEEAKRRYGAKDYDNRVYARYIEQFDQENTGVTVDSPPNSGFDSGSKERFVMVVEVYDLQANKLRVWSPDWKRDKWLYDGVEVEVEQETGESAMEKFDDIPFKTASGEVRVPLVPLYLSREPDCPMRGYSSLRRVYDQLREVNNMRTFQAQGVRRAARMLVTERGLLDEEARSKYAQGQDGEVIEIDLSQGQTVGDVLQPLPHTPVPPELERYAQTVDGDFARGSVMAPFTRGQATDATATEIQALAAYTASEVGRMARQRDQAITDAAAAYLAMLGVVLGDEGDVVTIAGELTALQAEDVLGDFEMWAEDSGNTPMSEAVRKQELERLTPMLQALGVPNDVLLDLLTRAFELPANIPGAAAEAMQQQQAAMQQQAGPPAGEEVPPEALSQARGGPSRVELALPEGGVV
jgi:hypothetical protein